MYKYIISLFIASLSIFGCGQNGQQKTDSGTNNSAAGNNNLQPALQSITAEEVLTHTKILASDAFEGRGPGTAGEDSTVNYLTAQFKNIGLQPGNPDGSYIQNVPMFGFTARPKAYFTAGGKTINLEFPKDYVAVSRRFVPDIQVTHSDLVFVGYGVVAPEFGWDDYKDVNVKGKTIVMLINDPPVTQAGNPDKLDSTVFGGKAKTY